MNWHVGDYAEQFLDLILPMSCPGCGAPGQLCQRCQQALRSTPQRVTTRGLVQAPVYACGTYSGSHRRIIIHAKERGNKYARQVMGMTLAATVQYLCASGVIMPPQVTPIALIPAPTRKRAAVTRGGDPITQACTFASTRLLRTQVAPLIFTSAGTADSADLTAVQRRKNLSGNIRPTAMALRENWQKYRGRITFLLVDDVITTGSTMAETELVLASLGIELSAAIGFARV